MTREITITRAWSMPSPNTFSIDPIADLLNRWLEGRGVIVDPFARNSVIGNITNDLNHDTIAQHHLPADEFCASLADSGMQADAVLFDPPYSPRQIAEVYEQIGRECGTADTQNGRLYRVVKDSLAAVLGQAVSQSAAAGTAPGLGRDAGLNCKRFFWWRTAARMPTPS
jgi:hypothetical protein